MFRHVHSPPESSFPTTLKGLNMVLNDAGKPVDATTGDPFAFFHSSDDRVNDMRKEAFHAAIRAEMKLKMAKYGVTEHYITVGNALSSQKPQEKHVPVLMTSVSKVQTSRDIIIIIGESGQDVGVFAWRLVRESIQRGTALGLAEAVKEKAGDQEEVPAMIFLNPGQLYYSHRANQAKTLVSWQDSPRQSSLQEFADEIQPENKLHGHATPGEHIHSFLVHILPKIVDQKARVYYIAIGDAAQHLLWSTETNRVKYEGIALVCPQIDTPKQRFSPTLHYLLAHYAKAWVPSDKPADALLAMPDLSLHLGLSHTRPAAGLTVEKIDSEKPTLKDKNMLTLSEALVPLALEDPDNADGEAAEGTAGNEPVESPLMPTFSAGMEDVGFIETTFDVCMPNVLEFLWMRRSMRLHDDRAVRKLEELRFKERNDSILAEQCGPGGENALSEDGTEGSLSDGTAA